MNSLSRITGLSPEVLARAVPVGRRTPTRAEMTSDSTEEQAARLPRENEMRSGDWLIACALCDAALWPTLDDDDHDALTAEAYSSALLQSVAFSLNHLALEGSPTELGTLLAELESPEASGAAVHLQRIAEASTEGKPERLKALWDDCLACLRRDRHRRNQAPGADLATRLAAHRQLRARYTNNLGSLPGRSRDPGG